MGKLTGKIAVVTGASKGIGAGIAKELAAHGASVVVNYASSKEGADKVVAEIERAGGKATAVGGSVAKQAEIDTLFAQTKKIYGKVDILVNNAGVYAFSPLEQITEKSIAHMFGVNVTGLLLATKAAAPLFPAEGGSVINIGSIVTELTLPGFSIYAATKASVEAITRVLSKELGEKKIRVNAVNPGPVETEGTAEMVNSELMQGMVDKTPGGRIGQPVDVARVVAFLASEDAIWVNGSILDAAGGLR